MKKDINKERFKFTISDENLKYLNDKKSKFGIKTKSEFLNEIIKFHKDCYYQAQSELETMPYDESRLKSYEYRIRLTQNENEFIKSQSKAHGISNTKEIKLRLLNTLYDEKFVPRIDIIDIKKNQKAYIKAFRYIKSHIENNQLYCIDENGIQLINELIDIHERIDNHLSKLSKRVDLKLESN